MTSQTDAATFTATEEEEQLATQVLLIKNYHTTGILNTDAATDVFDRSGLPEEMLRDIYGRFQTRIEVGISRRTI